MCEDKDGFERLEKKVWATSIVMRSPEGRIIPYATSIIADSFEEAVGIALSNRNQDMEENGLVVIAFDADYQDEHDLGGLLLRCGWKEPE